MKKLVRRATNERESMIEFSVCLCGCPCSGNCSCPPIPTHQIGIGVREQTKDSSGGSTAGSAGTYQH
ncbi:hypothetical protein SAMN02745217_02933 [Anaerocolumna xylanovorans DSM 12503]|uniref:Uncharacterized protein n=1 Tax=Anaerocolumna xylanovorans DSM 12503 TaxID=1121345 RepID=A0A1M7YDX4_9FIRM|nr:hypothetical protein SAMN02745217_02933 [Anaerocolumna xylanovorans DSM 12503]